MQITQYFNIPNSYKACKSKGLKLYAGKQVITKIKWIILEHEIPELEK